MMDRHMHAFKARGRAQAEARAEERHRRWETGKIPSQYVHLEPSMHARSFLYAIDGLQKELHELIKCGATDPPVPPGVATALKALEAAVPVARMLRNSAHHVEERAQGKAFGKPIALQPVMNNMIEAPHGGVVVIGSLNGNKLGYTLEDGSFGEVEISEATVETMQRTVQDVMDSFVWAGPPTFYPSDWFG
jgi:hypothetical protein